VVGGFVEVTGPKKHEVEVFAHESAVYMDHNKLDKNFKGLVLVAPPPFYCLLNKNLSDALKEAVIHVVEKDHVNEPKKEMEAHLPLQLTE
jgi:protein required for attachment to host cells